MLRRHVPRQVREAIALKVAEAPDAHRPATGKPTGHLTAPANSADIETRSFTLNGASQQIAPVRASRTGLLIQNNSAGIMYVNINKPASTSGLQIPPGGNYEPYIVPVGSIYILGTGNGVITEG